MNVAAGARLVGQFAPRGPELGRLRDGDDLAERKADPDDVAPHVRSGRDGDGGGRGERHGGARGIDELRGGFLGGLELQVDSPEIPVVLLVSRRIEAQPDGLEGHGGDESAVRRPAPRVEALNFEIADAIGVQGAVPRGGGAVPRVVGAFAVSHGGHRKVVLRRHVPFAPVPLLVVGEARQIAGVVRDAGIGARGVVVEDVACLVEEDLDVLVAVVPFIHLEVEGHPQLRADELDVVPRHVELVAREKRLVGPGRLVEAVVGDGPEIIADTEILHGERGGRNGRSGRHFADCAGEEKARRVQHLEAVAARGADLELVGVDGRCSLRDGDGLRGLAGGEGERAVRGGEVLPREGAEAHGAEEDGLGGRRAVARDGERRGRAACRARDGPRRFGTDGGGKDCDGGKHERFQHGLHGVDLLFKGVGTPLQGGLERA